MGVLHRSRRLARLAGCAALVFGLAGAAGVSGTALAQARVKLPVFGQHGVASWGVNEDCQLGNGVTSLAQLTPVQVTGLGHITQISAGAASGEALRSDGTVWAWGYNTDGELGNGTYVNRSVPVQVKGLSQVTRISAGRDRLASLAVSTSSTGVTAVWAWGVRQPEAAPLDGEGVDDLQAPAAVADDDPRAGRPQAVAREYPAAARAVHHGVGIQLADGQGYVG